MMVASGLPIQRSTSLLENAFSFIAHLEGIGFDHVCCPALPILDPVNDSHLEKNFAAIFALDRALVNNITISLLFGCIDIECGEMGAHVSHVLGDTGQRRRERRTRVLTKEEMSITKARFPPNENPDIYVRKPLR